MEAAVRFSQNSLPGQADQLFLKVDVAGRGLSVHNITSAKKHKVTYDLVYKSNKLQPFRAFDWHPNEASLVAIGQTGGEASLVNLADSSQSPVAFSVRSQRSCNAVGLNSQNWIAIGLDKVRNDFCLNIWDVNQRVNGSGKQYGKNGNEPLTKLAGGEPITSLRFFQDQPKLLAAGVKGQFIRLYDLRESTTSSALQFATRCVNLIAVDSQDENYFASCLQANVPTVSIWDRRMVSRTNIAHIGFGSQVAQTSKQPEVSVELKNVVDSQGQIWGLRFSKTRRGHLGVLSSTGQLRMLELGKDVASQTAPQNTSDGKYVEWERQEPQAAYLSDAHNFSNAFFETPQVEDLKRIVSFDYTTATSKVRRQRIITLTGDGDITVKSVAHGPSPYVVSSYHRFIDGKNIVEDKETLKMEQSVASVDSDRKVDPISDGTTSKPSPDGLSKLRRRCKAGYSLDASKNMTLCADEEHLKVFWSWLDHAQQVTSNGGMVQGDLNLSYLGVSGIWMEDFGDTTRMVKDPTTSAQSNVPTIISQLARRHNLSRGKGCPTEHPHYRALCLHISGMPITDRELEQKCQILSTNGEHTRAAAVALFAGEEKLAQKALRAKGTGHGHRMLSMALVGARHRRRRRTRNSAAWSGTDQDEESESSQDEDWMNTISEVEEDLTDSYSKAILAFVKTGNWEDVVKQQDLPLRYRVSIALRNFEDRMLSSYLGDLKRDVIESGSLEGILLTGLGTTDSIDLLRNYTKSTNDIQTAALAMSFAAASDAFLPPHSTHTRTVFCFREAYKDQLMSCGLKYDKARFDVAVSSAIRDRKLTAQPRKKEQIRLVCTHCNQSISQFGHEQQMQSQHITETAKHILTPEKAAVAGVVCPKCGRHLPRCGVCDNWLGTPDETFSKWYKPPPTQRTSQSVDLSASMAGSTVTAIRPSSNTPSVSITGVNAKPSLAKNLTTADLAPEAVEIVDEDVAKQEREKKWYDAMHKFTVFCTMCSHGFHAEHARMWFDGSEGREGHRVCPVPLCECACNG